MYAKFHYLQKHAQGMMTLAVKNGDLIPATHCEDCGKPADGRALDGHHHDYSKPLEVTWLCRSCHKYEHGAYPDRPSRKMKQAVEWLQSHPEHIETESRALGELIGVSHTLANEARKQVKFSANGHSDV